MGVLSDIAAISAGSKQLATDQATLTADMALVTAQQAAVAADAGSNAQADAALSSDLQALGTPAFVINADGTASVYTFATTPPGYTITVATPAT